MNGPNEPFPEDCHADPNFSRANDSRARSNAPGWAFLTCALGLFILGLLLTCLSIPVLGSAGPPRAILLFGLATNAGVCVAASLVALRINWGAALVFLGIGVVLAVGWLFVPLARTPGPTHNARVATVLAVLAVGGSLSLTALRRRAPVAAVLSAAAGFGLAAAGWYFVPTMPNGRSLAAARKEADLLAAEVRALPPGDTGGFADLQTRRQVIETEFPELADRFLAARTQWLEASVDKWTYDLGRLPAGDFEAFGRLRGAVVEFPSPALLQAQREWQQRTVKKTIQEARRDLAHDAVAAGRRLRELAANLELLAPAAELVEEVVHARRDVVDVSIERARRQCDDLVGKNQLAAAVQVLKALEHEMDPDSGPVGRRDALAAVTENRRGLVMIWWRTTRETLRQQSLALATERRYREAVECVWALGADPLAAEAAWAGLKEEMDKMKIETVRACLQVARKQALAHIEGSRYQAAAAEAANLAKAIIPQASTVGLGDAVANLQDGYEAIAAIARRAGHKDP